MTTPVMGHERTVDTMNEAAAITRVPLKRRIAWTGVAVALAVTIAGFWNWRVVDGIGEDMIAAPLIGGASAGAGFGFLFAVAAGLAATFTACNCVVFALIPGLACRADAGAARRDALNALGVFTGGLLVVSAAYGAFVGLLGPVGVEAYNTRALRLAQAQVVFTMIGLVLLAWGALELGFLNRFVNRLSPVTRAFFASPVTKAGILGVLVGLFSVGRPFSVFREFLAHAAAVESPLYGAGVMMVQGVGQVLVMVALFLILVYGFGARLTRWATERPHAPALLSAVALIAGGTFFVFYWGLAFAFDIGGWGWKLGWYN